ncbi:MAG: GLPGLI family protein, partial [Bacteroidia bacterium]|nr:GLPGLI family protein [Bacteroidia bacterium]
ARNYVYEETLQMPRWVIETETKEILGYLCQKATTECAGRKWIVFFSPQIPINKGPFKLWGLPGLVVEAQDSNGFFNFSLSSFEKLSEQIDIIYTHRTYSDKKYDKLSRKDFLKYETFSHKEPLGFMDTALGIKLTSFNDGGKEKMAALKAKGGIPLISLEIE